MLQTSIQHQGMSTFFDNYYDMMKLSIYLIRSGDRGEYHSILFDPIT